MSIDRKLTSLRAEQPLYQGLSFDTIAAYEAHGAIVHYEATPDTDAPLRPEGLLLLDSGAQYIDGTTDITRTIALGPVTDEPGIYLEGRFGVRIENVLLTQPWQETDFGRFLQFETLTLCPIDTAPLDVTLLTPEELQWLNDYHQLVFDRLSPHLDAPDRDWLRTATAPLHSQSF